MQNKIHPAYHTKAQVKCACGNKFETGSTKEDIAVELCSACHPFYTGKQKLVDTARRVEKFHAKVSAQQEKSQTRKGKKVKKETRARVKAEKKKNN
jgi:large subunit ribosomal protein L31